MGEGPVNRLAATGTLALCGLAGIIGVSVGRGLDTVQDQYEMVKPAIFSLGPALDFASSYGPGVMIATVVVGLVIDRYRVR